MREWADRDGSGALNHAINRTRLFELRENLSVPILEVFLSGNPSALMNRIERRAESPDAHPIKVHFTVDRARALLATPYPPLLEDRAVIRVDTTDLGTVDIAAVAGQVRARLTAA